ncbi:hypothetical protein ACOQFL_08550 [Actinopolyspora sp. H202]|uniref:hypothetical protein n=1 Tax=Actinopolyspora sp. H202 TaxID=1500456 RepID=UPI003EE79C45
MGGSPVFSEDLPAEVRVLDSWRRAGVDCAVGELRGLFYGFARLAGPSSGWSRYRPGRVSRGGGEALAPEKLGNWVVLEFGPSERFWSQEVRARFLGGNGELSGMDRWGWAWGLSRIHEEVDEFVDAQLSRG